MTFAPGAVLIVAHRFALGFGGVPESILLLARELLPHRIRVDVVCKDGIFRDVGTLAGLPAGGVAPDFGELRRLSLKSYNSVFVAGAWNPTALWLGLRARFSGVRLIYSPKGNLSRAEFLRLRDLKKFPYLITLELALLGLSQRIVFSSRLEHTSFVLGPLFRSKSLVIAEPFRGVPIAEQPDQVPVADRTVRFGFMAEIAPRKGLRELAVAFSEWQRLGNNAELHIAGEPRPGSERYFTGVRNVTATAPDPDRIVWRGALRGAAREQFYETIDFLVCPTKFESFGLTPLEALWHGKPVMVTHKMGVLEFISDKNSIIILTDDSMSEMLRGLTSAMTERDRYVAGARSWRSKSIPALAGDNLVSDFVRALGLEGPR